MGNRAVITLDNKTGIYLHWNGGRDSVEAFIMYCRLKEYRTDDYGTARLTQVIANFFGGSTSIGVASLNNLDCNNGDDGVYIIENWKIVKREYFEGQEQNEYKIIDMLKHIDSKQPESEQIFKDKSKTQIKNIVKKFEV